MIVSLSKLSQLVAVARSQSLTRAADELNISQPALSRTVAFIEGVYQVKIFDRTAHGMVMTDAGNAIVAEAERVLREAQSFDHNANLIGKGQLGRISFGMGPILANILMANVGIRLLTGGRKLSFRAQARRADRLIRAILDQELELGLVGLANLEIPNEIEVQRIGSLKTAIIARPGHPLAGEREITVDRLRSYTIAAPVELNLRPAFRSLEHTIACNDYEAIKEMVMATDLLCLGSEIFARKASAAGDVVVLDAIIPPSDQLVDIAALTLKGRSISPAAELVIQCCRELLEAGG
jgi:DNA-binding transcriptional LysR family regulator